MKRTITAFVLLIAIVIWSVLGIFIVQKENSSLVDVIKRIESCCEEDDMQEAEELAVKLESLWKKYERKMSLIVADEKLTELSMSISKIRPYCRDANDELLAELENIKRQLELVYKSELPLWYNIL
ncbi:MAG: DUF4363 family protein [Oscillospiraceae bacterium]